MAAPRMRSSIEQSLITEKTMDRLVQIVIGNTEKAVKKKPVRKKKTEAGTVETPKKQTRKKKAEKPEVSE